MKIYEIGTGYTSIPAKMGAATEIVVEEMTKSFLKDNVDVKLVDISEKNRLSNNLPIVEVKVPSVFTSTDTSLGIMHKLKRVIYSLKLKSKLKKLIKKETEPVLIHFHNQYNMYFFLKFTSKRVREKVKIAYSVHSGVWALDYKENEEMLKGRYFQEAFSVQNADYVLVLNDKTKDNFVEYLGVDPKRIYKIKNGVNTDIYSPLTESENEEFKKSIGLEGKNYVFQVGSVRDLKNQFGAVKLMCEYLKSNRDIAYVYAGGIIDEEYHREMRAYAEENGVSEQVIYAGELAPGELLNKYYSAASASIFTSKMEAFGMVIIEAISSATHVLISNEVVFDLDKGYTVFRDENELSALLDKYLNKKHFDLDGRQEVVEKYGWDVVAKEHLGIFQGN